MSHVSGLLSRVDAPTAVAAAALVFLVLLVIRIGKILVMAGVFGAIAGGASLSQGSSSKEAVANAAVAFGVAAVMFFLVKMTKSIVLWLAITAAGVAGLIAYGMHRIP
jgi:hypothetical protein